VLTLRRGTVVEAADPGRAMQRLEVERDGERRPALADVALVGPSEVGDEVVVNVAARDLGLGSGGHDVLHVNLTRGLDGEGLPEAHVMKLNYTSLQHAVLPVEGDALALPVSSAVGIFFLHGQLAPAAWAFQQAAPHARLGHVQTAGGALPGGLSENVRRLKSRGLLDGHLTAGAAFGGDGEAISTPGAIHHAAHDLGWDAVLCGPGPGILGSASRLGHGGMTALDSIHAALALGAPTLVIPRMSSGDDRARHRGVSHHSTTVLQLVLDRVVVAAPEGFDEYVGVDERHDWRRVPADLEGYGESGLPSTTMGRALEEDALFFAAALAGGRVLGEMSVSP
jgi:Protein of unknown function (DUF3866)